MPSRLACPPWRRDYQRTGVQGAVSMDDFDKARGRCQSLLSPRALSESSRFRRGRCAGGGARVFFPRGRCQSLLSPEALSEPSRFRTKQLGDVCPRGPQRAVPESSFPGGAVRAIQISPRAVPESSFAEGRGRCQSLLSPEALSEPSRFRMKQLGDVCGEVPGRCHSFLGALGWRGGGATVFWGRWGGARNIPVPKPIQAYATSPTVRP